MEIKRVDGTSAEVDFHRFRTMDRRNIDLVGYVKEYMKTHPDIQLLIGCDSQNRGGTTLYALVIGFYNVGHGAHVIFKRWRTARERVGAVRLLNEVWASVEVAELLKSEGLPRPTYIDIDINPDPKFKSNEVFRQAVGLCEGMGYTVRYKHTAPLVTTMADFLVRH